MLQAAVHIIRNMNRDDVHFRLVCDGVEFEKMKPFAQELGFVKYVTFTGRVPDQETLEMLNTADVCVNPEIANDMNDKSTMNKIMEYMALARPIVQYGLKEGKVSAQDAWLYAEKNNSRHLAAKIVQLLDDESLRRSMGEYGRKHVENELCWVHEAPKLLKAYDKLFSC